MVNYLFHCLYTRWIDGIYPHSRITIVQLFVRPLSRSLKTPISKETLIKSVSIRTHSYPQAKHEYPEGYIS